MSETHTHAHEVHTNLCYLLLLLSIPTFIVLQFYIVAPFGRHAHSIPNSALNSKVVRFLFLPTLPPRYSWMCFESPNLIWSCYYYFWNCTNWKIESCYNGILLGLFTLHYLNRAVIYPLRMDNSKGQRVPVIVFLSALSFCTLNGYLQAYYLMRVATYENSASFNISFIIGIIIFFAGMIINIHSDSILKRLKSQSKNIGDYSIPYGGLYILVSCPNYYGEILEWIGFAIACQSLPAFSFCIYTASNLVPRALTHHQWYLEKFDHYPKDRKAIIPLLL